MNKIKALVTMLVLGTSAAAFAAPTATVEYNRGPAPTATIEYNTQGQREWRQPMPAPAPAPVIVVQAPPLPEMQHGGWHHQERWTTLASSAKIQGSAEVIRVGAQAGRFDKLELKQLSGKTQISLVKINFTNGQSQWARLNTTLDRNNTLASIALNGQNRSISSIVVYGSSNARSSYSILAA